MRGRRVLATLVKTKRPLSSGMGKRPEDRTVQELLKDGVLVIDKPSGPTSHQVTSWVADMLGAPKAAHGGTLDPRVTGVLPVGVGIAVRAIDVLHYGTKAYVGVMKLHGSVDKRRLEEVFADFTGEIYQIPPVRSAVKREMRTRTIERLALLEESGRDVLFEVDCDSGTYIRSLCVDIGDALAVGAHLQDLRRTRAGTLTERDLVSLHDLRDAIEDHKKGDSKMLRSMLRPMEILLTQVPHVVIKDSAVDAVCHGAALAVPGIVELDEGVRKSGPVVLDTLNGEGVALGTALMDPEEMLKRNEGMAVAVSRVFMKPGTYPALWTSSREQR